MKKVRVGTRVRLRNGGVEVPSIVVRVIDDMHVDLVTDENGSYYPYTNVAYSDADQHLTWSYGTEK